MTAIFDAIDSKLGTAFSTVAVPSGALGMIVVI
jgi:hypothetical protein